MPLLKLSQILHDAVCEPLSILSDFEDKVTILLLFPKLKYMWQKVGQRPNFSPTGFLLHTECEEVTAD